LRAVCDVTRRPLLADTQQTTACARVWARLYLAASAALVEGQSPWLVGFLDDKLLLV
jgi:hypothetical protein